MTSRKLSHPAQIIVLALILIAIFVYLPPYHNAFIGDDYVQQDYIDEFLSRPYAAHRVFNPYWLPWYYRPLQNLWFLANRLVFGLNPFGYYALQLGIHALAVALVYRVSRQFRLRPFAAAFTAALFAIHGHHLDVVAWLSSIAIVMAAVFSLAALSAFLAYLNQGQARSRLLLTAVFCLLALLAHEEGFLLPPLLFLLLLMRRLQIRDWRLWRAPGRLRSQIANLWQTRQETAVFLFLFCVMAVYLLVQLDRPNLNISSGDVTTTVWRHYLEPLQISLFLVETLTRYTLLTDLLPTLSAYSYLAAYLLLAFLGLWAWKGQRVTRWGLAWAALHLTFIYFVLWSQKPEFYAGRHIYNAWIGIVLALGATVDDWLKRPNNYTMDSLSSWLDDRISSLPGLRSSPTPLKRASQILLVVLLTAVLFSHINVTRKTQAAWLAGAEEDKMVEAQMKRLLPQVTENTHVFAHRFVIAPSFMRAVVQVWYNQMLSEPGGSLDELRWHGRASDDFYLFDYENETLTNLMPTLQAHDETVFLWSQTPEVKAFVPSGETAGEKAAYTADQVVGPAHDRRLALLTHPPASDQSWLSLAYTVTVPHQSQLRFGLGVPADEATGEGDMTFRVRLSQQEGQEETIYQRTLASDLQAGWLEATIPMDDYWGKQVVLRLEVVAAGDSNGPQAGYWANPRFVIDSAATE